MTARTPATLRAEMPDGVTSNISALKMRDLVDTLEARSLASVREFGAALDGATDDTAAWRAALASGRTVYFPEGVSVVTGRLDIGGDLGVGIVGAGRGRSRFAIPATFDMAAGAVVRLGSVFQVVRGVAFEFAQPAAATRPAIIRYPPAIDLNGQPRAELRELRIDAAWDGISALGNCGGAMLDDLQVGAFNMGLRISGSLDSVRLDRYHFWPFGIAHDAGLYATYSDGNTFAAEFGRVDDLKIQSFIAFRGRVRFYNPGDGATFGTASGVALDSDYSRLEFEDGEMSFGQLNGSTALADDFLIRQTGGDLRVSGLALEGPAMSQAMVQVQGAGTAFVASDIRVVTLGGSPVFEQAGGVMHLNNGYFLDTSAVNRPGALVNATGGRATLTALRASDALGGTRTFLRLVNDDHHMVVGNTKTGWTNSFPASQVLGVYAPNN